MKIFQRHLFKSLLLTTLGLGGILTVIIWLTQSLRFWRIVAHQGENMQELSVLLLCLLPNVVLMVMPLGFLGALLWCFFRLVQDNERDVISGCGVGRWFFMQPAFLLALLLSFLLCFFSFYLAPKALHRMKEGEYDLRHSMSAASISPGLFLDMGDRMLYVHKQIGPALFQGIIIQDDRHPDRREVVTGHYAQVVQYKKEIKLFISNGSHQQIFKKSQKAPSMMLFERYILTLRPKQTEQRKASVHEKTVGKLLREYADMEDSERIHCRKELQQRLLLAFLPLTYCFWSAFVVLRTRFRRRRRYQPILVALAGVVVLESSLLAGLNPQMPGFLFYLTCVLYLMPFFLWAITARPQK